MSVRVVPYDDAWPALFAVEQQRLQDVLAPWLTAGVHHIGSTSVPGLPAKPVLDMLAGVRDLEQARAAVAPLEALGWTHAEHRPHEALWFHTPTAHLHLTVPGSDLWRERLAFRDALRADAGLRDEYARCKQALTGHDLRGYTDGKRPFVARVLATAGIDLPRR